MIYLTVALVVVIAFLLLHRPTNEKIKKVSSDVVGVCAVVLERTSQKEERKARVLELLQENGEMGNEDIRERLGVSARSVVNYLNELEAEGETEQVGEIGRNVIYRLKT